MSSFIIITDSFPAANGAGISQTIFNLFEKWHGDIFILARPTEKIAEGPVLPAMLLTCQFENFRTYGNRWLKRLNPFITKVNFNRQQQLKMLPAGWPDPRQAWVLVSTTEPIKLHFAWCLLRQGYTVIPYFMDDWLSGNHLKWKAGNIQQVAKDILQSAPCWLMISRQLEATLRKRYGLDKKPCLIVHNPAPDLISSNSNRKQTPTLNQKSEIRNHQIIYAGSIWPMHADALIATARAIHHLNEAVLQHDQGGQRLTPACRQGRVNACPNAASRRGQPTVVSRQSTVIPTLTIYTSEAHWKKYRYQLQGPGVTYGGWKPFNEVHEALQDAWLLLCTASFDEHYKAFSDSSVQTKLTDYMAVGKPILMVGPAEGASAQFIHEWDCGYSINTANSRDIEAQLLAIIQMNSQSEKKASNGLAASQGYFQRTAVQQRLYSFLDKHKFFLQSIDF